MRLRGYHPGMNHAGMNSLNGIAVLIYAQFYCTGSDSIALAGRRRLLFRRSSQASRTLLTTILARPFSAGSRNKLTAIPLPYSATVRSTARTSPISRPEQSTLITQRRDGEIVLAVIEFLLMVAVSLLAKMSSASKRDIIRAGALRCVRGQDPKFTLLKCY